jgi:EAL domain-containing protein (putative c-di-GMP-specific phosphodiesterase class I)
MVALAHSIGLSVVVEGVETAGQLEALFESEADDVQGFLLGRPAPVEKHLPKLAELKPAAVAETEAILIH